MRTRSEFTSWRHSQRFGFTITELLIVITIIGVLAALLLPAVLGSLQRAKEVQQATDISELEIALNAFKDEFGVYPPSRIRLREASAYDNNDPFDRQSVYWLQRIWPNIQLPTDPMAMNPRTLLWCKDTPGKTAGTTTYELEGDECLVFFLGGIAEFNRANPTAPIIMHGFTDRPRDPSGVPDPTLPQTLKRKGPFFDFGNRAGQLYVRTGADEVFSPLASQYTEEFGGTGMYVNAMPQNLKLPSLRSRLNPAAPVAYFSSYEDGSYRPHDLNLPAAEELNNSTNSVRFQAKHLPTGSSTAPFFQVVTQSPGPNPYSGSQSDPARPPASNANGIVWFQNEKTFQIIVAGRDGFFGPGGQIPFDLNGTIVPEDSMLEQSLRSRGAAYDNMTNISKGQLLGVYNESQIEARNQ